MRLAERQSQASPGRRAWPLGLRDCTFGQCRQQKAIENGPYERAGDLCRVLARVAEGW